MSNENTPVPDDIPLLHRDDIDFEDAEQIVNFFEEQFPGMKVVFAGDSNHQLPPEILEQIQTIRMHGLASVAEGTCIDCNKKMLEAWPPENDDWEMPEGWVVLTDRATNEPGGFLCPDCNKEDDVIQLGTPEDVG